MHVSVSKQHVNELQTDVFDANLIFANVFGSFGRAGFRVADPGGDDPDSDPALEKQPVSGFDILTRNFSSK